MPEIQILNPGCEDDDDRDDERERGERGKRGKRGHRGHRGPPGPPGPPGSSSGGLLKFSGLGAGQVSGTFVSYLVDSDGASVGGPSTTAPGYPVAIERSLVNLAVNLLSGFSVSGSVTIDLIKNLATAPVIIATITYVGGVIGIKTVAAGPVALAIGDTFDLRVTTVNAGGNLNMSATVGVAP